MATQLTPEQQAQNKSLYGQLTAPQQREFENTVKNYQGQGMDAQTAANKAFELYGVSSQKPQPVVNPQIPQIPKPISPIQPVTQQVPTVEKPPVVSTQPSNVPERQPGESPGDYQMRISGGTSGTGQIQPIQAPGIPKPPIEAAVVKTETKPTTTTGTTTPAKATAELKAAAGEVGQDRSMVILGNLNEGYKNAPDLFKDYQTYITAYGTNADGTPKTASEKAILDAYWQSKQPRTEDDIFKMYSGAGKIYDQNIIDSPEGVKAKYRIDTVGKYKTQNADQLFNSMKIGDIVPGTQAWNDLATSNGGETQAMMDAKLKYDAYMKSSNSSSSFKNMYDYSTGGETNKSNALEELSKKIQDELNASGKGEDYGTRLRESLAGNSEIKALSEQTNALNTQILDYEKQQRDILDDVKKQYPGMPESMQISMANRLTKPITDKLYDLRLSLAEKSANLKYLTGIEEKIFDYNIKKEDTLRSERLLVLSDLMGYERQKEAATTAFERSKQLSQLEADLGIEKTKELEQYKAELGLATNQAEFEQKLDQQLQLANDPVTGVDSILSTYASLGILPQRSRAEIISDIQNQVANGTPIGEALSNLNKLFQSKPDYQAIMQNKALESKGAKLEYDIKKAQLDALTNKAEGLGYTKIDDNLYQDNKGNVVTRAQLENMAGSQEANKTYQNAISVEDGKNGGSCGRFVNNVLGKSGFFTNTLEEKKAKINTQEPSIGSAVIMDSPDQPKYGHVGIVVDIQGDKLIVKDSNWVGPNTVGTHEVAMDKVYGYYTPGLENIENEQTKEKGFNTDRLPQYSSYIENGTIPAGIKQGTREYDSFIKEAKKGYTTAKNEEYKTKGFVIDNPDTFINNSTKRKDEISAATTNVQPFVDSMDRLISLVKEYGTENPYSEAGKMMNSEVKNAQLLAKEIYNLGVLNGPDLSLMESIIQNPTSLGAMTLGKVQDYEKLLEKGKQTVLENMISKAKSIGLKYVGSGGGNANQSSGNTGTTGKEYEQFF